MSEHLLHYTILRAPNREYAVTSEPTKAALFLHGILGTGTNLRGLAQAFMHAHSDFVAVLVDLRLHGRSRGLPPPHDVQACAADLDRLASQLPVPVRAVVGHSFGGKVALAYHALHPELERLASLDSAPGARPDRAGSEETMAVLAMLEQLPTHYDKREDFVARVHAEGHSRAIGEWLAMNLERTPDGFALAVDLDGIRALLDSHFSLDLWSVLELSRAEVDVVIGGRSRVWDAADRARVQAIADRAATFRVHVLPSAGHWVHADAPEALRAALFP